MQWFSLRRAGGRLALTTGCLFLLINSHVPAASTVIEEARVCGFLGIESAMFNAWRELASRGRPAGNTTGYGYETLVVRTSDNRSLAGYRISSNTAAAAARAILVLQGNATLADQLRDELPYFAKRGFDVFVFDYRGYGKSNGMPLLKPISQDQALIAEFVRGKGYGQVFLYGISMGGVYALSPHMPISLFDAVAVDSSPATLPWYALCPPEYDPISNVPANASRIIVISGGQDDVVADSDVEPLGKIVRARGGKYVHEPSFGHPFMDGLHNTLKRFKTVTDFFESVRR